MFYFSLSAHFPCSNVSSNTVPFWSVVVPREQTSNVLRHIERLPVLCGVWTVREIHFYF